ncbi:MAG: SDR family oxidoreductase [Candidatus Bipolaricaulia bacterium]
MSLATWLKGPGPSGFGPCSTADEVTRGLDLSDWTALVTGCNSGLGFETMRVLAERGATVLGTARTEAKARHACESIDGDAVPLVCDLAEPASVRGCVEAVRAHGQSLDAIIANAGIMALPQRQQAYGYERQFLTNHVGHFMLVTGLLDRLSEHGRVVMLSSSAHERAPAEGIRFDDLSGEGTYDPWTAYGQSKLANLLFARELARRFEGTSNVATAVHPGVIQTNLARHLNPLLQRVLSVIRPVLLKSIPQGAATQVYAAVHPDAARLNGAYLADCNVAEASSPAQDPALAERLWAATEEIVAGLPA